jgi:hypothetical protein
VMIGNEINQGGEDGRKLTRDNSTHALCFASFSCGFTTVRLDVE